VAGEKEFQGRGVSFSAISHAQFFRGRDVAVVGGERGLAAVLKLAPLAKRVYYILAQKNELRGLHRSETVLRNANVQLFYDGEVQGVIGDEFVTGLDLVGVNGATRTLPVEGVFIEFGLLPNVELVRDLVALADDGHILLNQHCETSVPGLFAAGDVTNVQAEQVPVAIGEGVKAALSAWSYLAAGTM
jgi:thioredoxin reductase